MRLRTRMFLALLTVSITLVLGMVGLFQWSFVKGLDEFLHNRQANLLSEFSDSFASYYEEYGSFRDLPLRLFIWQQEQGSQRIPDDLVLLDHRGQRVLGPAIPPTELTLAEVKVRGYVAGWVGMPDVKMHRDRLGQRFYTQQRETLIAIMAPALLLCLLVTWLLSRHLLHPIEDSVRLARRLGEGDYQSRLAVTRGDELGELQASMNRLAHSLGEASASREKWLADISHELRTPVAVLQGELEALVDGVRPMNEQNLQSLHQEVLHLKSLLDDLHDLALADAGALRYRFTQVDFSRLCQEAAQTASNRFAQAGIRFDYQVPKSPLLLEGDATRLRQLLDNLLENSLKYTDSGGSSQLLLQEKNGQIQLTLSDSAPGVSNQDLPKLFEHLYRVEASRNRQTGGAGLGLALCQRIVTAHRGHIRAEQSPLGGVSIIVNLSQQP